MQRGTPISERGKHVLPPRKYAPAVLDECGVPWCSGCGLRRMPAKSNMRNRCMCDELPPGSKRQPRELWTP